MMATFFWPPPVRLELRGSYNAKFPSLTESLAIIIFVPVLCFNDSMLLIDLLIHLSAFTMLIEWCCRVSESSESSKRTSHVMNGVPRGLILVRRNGVPPRMVFVRGNGVPPAKIVGERRSPAFPLQNITGCKTLRHVVRRYATL